MKRVVALFVALLLTSPNVRGAEASSPRVQEENLTAWQLGLYPIGETLGQQIEDLITIAQFGIHFENYRIENEEWSKRPEYYSFLLHLALQMRPAVRVLNYVGDPELFSAPEEKFLKEEWDVIHSALTSQERFDLLEKTASYRGLRTWEKQGVALSLQAESEFQRFSQEGLLTMKISDVPCGDICDETKADIQQKLPKGDVYTVESVSGHVRVWVHLPKTDSDVVGFSQPLENTPPEFQKWGPAIYAKASDLFYKWPMGQSIASLGQWGGDRLDGYLSDEEYRSILALIVAPTGRALQGQLAKTQRTKTIARLFHQREMAKGWIEARHQAEEIEEAQLRLREMVNTLRGKPKIVNILRRLWPFSREPGVSRQMDRVMSTYKAGKFARVSNLSGRILSIIGKSLLIMLVAADTASAFIARGEPRDVVIKKVVRIFADGGLGGGALFISASLPVLGLVLAGVAIAGELGHAFIHPDIPTTEDFTEAITGVLSDGYRLSSDLFHEKILGRNAIAEDWMKFRDKPIRFRVASSDEIRESSLRVIDLSDIQYDSTDSDENVMRYRRNRQIYEMSPEGFRHAVTELGGEPEVADRILRSYAKRYLETIFSALTFLGQIAPNRALASFLETALPGTGLAQVAVGRECIYQLARRDEALYSLSRELSEYLELVRRTTYATNELSTKMM